MPELLDIVGQDLALVQLQQATAGGRRPHAFIFTGPEGVGRQTTAVEFAKLLLCQRPGERKNRGRLAGLSEGFVLRQGCGTCASCRALSAGTHPDLHLVYKELGRYHDDARVRDRKMQALSIEVVRDFLIGPAYRAAAAGRGIIFVVRQAELMTVPAHNALLKTLEEPPPGVTVILICVNLADLLPTTRSRCQVVRFGPLPVNFVAETLVANGLDEPEGRFWAVAAGGSIGRAQRLAAEGLYPFARDLPSQLAALDVRDAADLAETLWKTMGKLAKRFQRRDEDLAATLANRQAGQILMGLLATVYRDGLAVAAGASRPLAHAAHADAVARIAERFGSGGLADILAQLARLEGALWRNVGVRLLWDNVAVACASPEAAGA